MPADGVRGPAAFDDPTAPLSMEIVASLEALAARRGGMPGRLGVVPTMGALHDGHLSLVRRARAECDRVAVTIFVNPAQFGPHEDLAAYPRDLPRDLELLRAERTDLVFTPTESMIYPGGFSTWVIVERLTERWEGTSRPGHFRGVATVVLKLLKMVRAERAYFGEKDYQQLRVVERMVRDLNVPTVIVPCPTVREPDGLAMSSRNAYLKPAERQAATALWRGLSVAREACRAGERDGAAARSSRRRRHRPRAAGPPRLRRGRRPRDARAGRAGRARWRHLPRGGCGRPGPPDRQPAPDPAGLSASAPQLVLTESLVNGLTNRPRELGRQHRGRHARRVGHGRVEPARVRCEVFARVGRPPSPPDGLRPNPAEFVQAREGALHDPGAEGPLHLGARAHDGAVDVPRSAGAA